MHQGYQDLIENVVTLHSIVPGVPFQARVRARNAGGWGPPSEATDILYAKQRQPDTALHVPPEDEATGGRKVKPVEEVARAAAGAGGVPALMLVLARHRKTPSAMRVGLKLLAGRGATGGGYGRASRAKAAVHEALRAMRRFNLDQEVCENALKVVGWALHYHDRAVRPLLENASEDKVLREDDPTAESKKTAGTSASAGAFVDENQNRGVGGTIGERVAEVMRRFPREGVRQTAHWLLRMLEASGVSDLDLLPKPMHPGASAADQEAEDLKAQQGIDLVTSSAAARVAPQTYMTQQQKLALVPHSWMGPNAACFRLQGLVRANQARHRIRLLAVQAYDRILDQEHSSKAEVVILYQEREKLTKRQRAEDAERRLAAAQGIDIAGYMGNVTEAMLLKVQKDGAASIHEPNADAEAERERQVKLKEEREEAEAEEKARAEAEAAGKKFKPKKKKKKKRVVKMQVEGGEGLANLTPEQEMQKAVADRLEPMQRHYYVRKATGEVLWWLPLWYVRSPDFKAKEALEAKAKAEWARRVKEKDDFEKSHARRSQKAADKLEACKRKYRDWLNAMMNEPPGKKRIKNEEVMGCACTRVCGNVGVGQSCQRWFDWAQWRWL